MMIDLENYLNCKDCRIKNECAIFRAVKAFYCISDLDNKNTDKVPLKQCPACRATMCKSTDGEGEVTHECVYCGSKIEEKKQVTIDKEEYIKLKENYKDSCGYEVTGENQVTISEKQYKQLLIDSEKLAAIEHFGSKNWKCYKELTKGIFD
jgi:hypothetical protein